MRKILLLTFIIAALFDGSVFALAQTTTDTTATTTDTSSITRDAFNSVSSTTEDILRNFRIRTETELPSGVTIPETYRKVPVTMDLTPEFPGANQTVTIKLISYSTNLQTNMITWSVNGSVRLAKTGATSFTLTTGNFGQVSNVTASVVADNGFVTSVSTSIVPTAVDMMWQANTYTPPFYKGKALNSHQAAVVVVANPTVFRPNGTRVSPDNLIYRWEYNDKFIDSGLGKKDIVITDSIPSEGNLVRVDISTVDGQVKTRGQIRLTSVEPKVLLYEEGPDGVRYEKSLSPNNLNIGLSTKISASPYFFAVKTRNAPELNYSWFLNGEKTNNTKAAVTLAFSEKTGRAYVETEASISTKMFQRAKNALSVNFSENARNNQTIF